MLKNEEIIEEFKKSLSATIRSIGKDESLEINYVKENPSINGKVINITEPNMESIKKNLSYLRAEADSLALELRLHSKEIHKNFINNNELANEIINALEQSRFEVKGSEEFKGIKRNLTEKHIKDLEKETNNLSKNKLVDAFRYVAYEELSEVSLGINNNVNKEIIKKKLKKNYDNFFSDLKANLNDQEKYTSKILNVLKDLGIFQDNHNKDQTEEIEENEIDENNENNENQNDFDQKNDESKIEMQTSETEIEQSLSINEDEEMGDDSSDTELEYFPKIESLEKLENYKVYSDSFDEVVSADDLCDIKELEKLRINLALG